MEQHLKWLFHHKPNKSQRQPKEVQAPLQVVARGGTARPIEAKVAIRIASTLLGLLEIAPGHLIIPLDKRQNQRLGHPRIPQAPKRRVELLPPNLAKLVAAREALAEVMTLIIVVRAMIQEAGAEAMMRTASVLRHRLVPEARSRNLV